MAAGDPVSAASVAQLTPNVGVYSLFRTTTYDLASNGNVDYTGAFLSFTKMQSSTGLLVTVAGSGFANLTAAGYSVTYGVNIGGIDYDILRYFYQALATHYAWSGQLRIPSASVAAGVYTVQLRARNSIASRQTRHDSSDFISVSVMEIA